VHLDLAAEFTGAAVAPGDDWVGGISLSAGARPAPDLSALKPFIAQSRRPLMLVGLGARDDESVHAVRELAARGVPALVTYKAKGVVPDTSDWFAGVLTNGALERRVLEATDLFIAVGLDAVELIPRDWSYSQPLIAVSGWSVPAGQLPVANAFVGDIPATLSRISDLLEERSEWKSGDVRRLAESQRSQMRPAGASGRLHPHRVVDLTAAQYPGATIAVDAGAHMFPVMSLWPSSEPRRALISNGLSTMGFALPSAIGAAFVDRRPVIAFTGDGGLFMCISELLTAAREELPVRTIVFDDQSLSLIRLKQEQRGYAVRGVEMGRTRWVDVGRGFGIVAREVSTEEELQLALRETAEEPGPVLIGARIARETYPAAMQALRG